MVLMEVKPKLEVMARQGQKLVLVRLLDRNCSSKAGLQLDSNGSKYLFSADILILYKVTPQCTVIFLLICHRIHQLH